MSAWIVGPKGSFENRRLRAMRGQLFHARGDLAELDPLLRAPAPHEEVGSAVLERLLPDGEAHRATDQIGVRELLPRPLVAVVQEHGDARLRKSRLDVIALLL